MVKSCVLCRAPQIVGSLLSFHRFPKNKNRRRQWITACGLKNMAVIATAVLCSEHFVEDDYDETNWPTKRLKATAIPSLSRLQNQMASASPSVTVLVEVYEEVPNLCEQSAPAALADPPCQEDLEVCDPLRHTPTKKLSTVRNVNDLQELHFSSPDKTNPYLKLVKGKKGKVQVLRVQNKRLKNRIDSLKNLLQHLREEHLQSEEAANSRADL